MVEYKLFHEVTGLTWDINKLIDSVKTKTDDDKKELLRKLDWYIPEGAYLAGSTKRDKAIELINAVATELGVELSEVFVDIDNDGDVDAYDVIDVKEPKEIPAEKSLEEVTEVLIDEPTEEPVDEQAEAPAEELVEDHTDDLQIL